MHIKTITPLAVLAALSLAVIGVSDVLADEPTAPQAITNASHVTLTLENHAYYPGDVVRFYVQGAADPTAIIVDPLNSTYGVPLTGINDSYFVGEYDLSQGIILGNYTVMAVDNATGAEALDTFEVATRTVAVTPTAPPALYLFISMSKADYLPGEKAVITVETNAGTPTVAVRDPANNTAYMECESTGSSTGPIYSAAYELDRAVVLGNYTVLAYVNENETYCSATAGFNVTMGEKADKSMRVRYAAYDPAQKAIVLRANVNSSSTEAASAVQSDPAVMGMAVKAVKVLDAPSATAKEGMMIDVLIPVDSSNVNSVVSQYNLTPDITKATTSVAVSADGSSVHLSLNDKVDGCWYRLSAPVPDGYRVLKIARDDGTEITNDVQIDRETGEYLKNEINWYVDNGTLYFYDDPINGYDIALQPPAASNSLAVNVVSGGQISAIVYPFNQGDSSATIASNDHLGYSEDNGYANDIDADAGAKTAIRMYRNNNVNPNNRIMFGNDGDSYSTYSDDRYEYTDIGAPGIVGFNTVPDGSVESVIISNFRTPQPWGYGVPSYVNVTQKTIIRNNNLWFATVYYINNAGTADISNLRFYQGADFNFNGRYSWDDDFYNSAGDMVYGYTGNSNPSSIHVGGYRSTLTSSAHDVARYGDIWDNIAADDLDGRTSTNNIDAGMALAWDGGTLARGETWTVPVIWAVGSNTTDFTSTLNYALSHNMTDVGVKSIDSPASGYSTSPAATPSLTINATAMDVGVIDQSPTVYLQVKNSAGQVVHADSRAVQLSVPYRETARVSYSWNLAGVPAGTYTINVYTQLSGDQNTANDLKSITVYISDFSLYPDQSGHVNPGDSIFYALTLASSGAAGSFDLSASASSAGWPTYLYYTDTSILIAEDDNGDGAWDSVNNAYRDPATGLPWVSVPSGGSRTLLAQKLAPASADTGVLDTTTIKASLPGQPAVNSTATLKTDTPFQALAGKTFYMHEETLNTAPETAASAYTPVQSVFAMWSQTPAFADDFIVAGNVTIPIYYTARGSIPITVTLFYTNGAGNTALIGSNTTTFSSRWWATSKTIVISPPGGNVTIPKGSYLVLKIDNVQTTEFSVYYDNSHRTCIQVNTPTYVHVDSIATYNDTAPTSGFAPGDTARVVANVSDPIGAYDISSARISITAPNGSYVVNNQSMAYTSTDPANPPLWKSFTYSAALGSSLQPGVYTVNVTGYESNGVIHTKATQITVAFPDPAVLIVPDNSQVALPNTVRAFNHTVTNLNGARSDVVDITATGTLGWAISLFKADGVTPLPDTDGDGKPDAGSLAPLGSADIVVRISVPSSAGTGSVDTVTVTATSSNDVNAKSTATDTLLVPTISAVKTLYLHDSRSASGGTYLDTSSATSVSGSETIAARGSDEWVQTPVFARSFNIQDDPAVTLYARTNDWRADIDVSLISTNGVTRTTLGSLTSYRPSVTYGAITPITFNILLSSPNVTIPSGNQLILRIENNNRYQQLTVFGSSQYPSRIDMNTSSYVNVQSVSLMDTSNNPISSATPPLTVRVRANVTDPFGSFDITGATLTVKDSNDSTVIGPMAMALLSTDTGSPSLWKQYQNDVALPETLDTGNYQFIVTATESNGVRHTSSSVLAIEYPVNVSVTQSIAPAGADNFVVTLRLANEDTHSAGGVRAYDFYSAGFTVSGFSDSRVISQPVNNGILSGTINVFGPFDLSPGQTITIVYNASGSGNYNIADFQVVGVDPDA